MTRLKIENLHASINETQILKGLNLEIKKGEIHAIMGTNGSGKSTLSKVLTGHPAYTVNNGNILFENQNINKLSPEERSQLGIFLAFQYPVEIPGVSNEEFLRIAYNLKQKSLGKKELDPIEFFKILQTKLEDATLNINFLNRNVNEGFSGGEKKRNEILQMAILEPRFCILDETDSGLDVDAMRQVSNGVNSLRSNDRSFLIITHYQRLLNYIKPDFVHIMAKGKIIKTGGPELALEVEEQGYSHLLT